MNEHVQVCVEDAVGDDLARADVLYFTSPIDAHQVIAQMAAYPGCVICAGTAPDGTVLLAVRGGIGSCPAVASIVHALLTWRVTTAT
jgi:hypothetical protein